MEENINVVENLTQAISILNKTDEYFESLNEQLSDTDSLKSDYEHFIETTPIEEVDLKKLYLDMQEVLLKRRNIKQNMTIRDNYNNLRKKLCYMEHREFLISDLKNVEKSLDTTYKNRILNDIDIANLKINTEKPKRGRPRKNKEEI